MVSRPGPVAVAVRSRGTVTPRRDIELVSEVSGRVIEVAPEFVEGGQVRAGATLLRIDPIDYEVALSDAQAALASARLSLAEVQVVLMKAAIEEAEARVQAAKDRVRQARADLANTRITAPFDAIVDGKRADIGQYVQTGTAVMRLMGTALVEVRLPVLAADVPFLRYGRQPDGSWPAVQLTANFGDVEHRWPARLMRVEQRVDEQTRVFYLVAEVDSPYDPQRYAMPLTVGLFVQADIPGREIPAATRLPRSALHAGHYVYLVEQGVLVKREVQPLRHEGGAVIVGEGLGEGDRVVLSQLDLMVEGMAVTVGN